MDFKGIFVAVVFSIFAIIWYKTWRNEEGIVRSSLNTHYDYIIVGAGTAGCVVANRLSEDSNVSVLLLEAGDEETSMPSTAVPSLALTQARTSADWNFTSVSQKYVGHASDKRREAFPRGKILGGSSAINAMHYNRGSRHDFDYWGEMGCKGWSFEEVLPYFVKSENNHNQKYRKSEYHGDSGPLHLTDGDHPLVDTFVQAAEQLGHRHKDQNDGDNGGVMGLQSTAYHGVRSSAAAAYLRPAMTRDNLHVAVLSHVTKILFEEGRASGVEFIRNGVVQQVFARQEVILSAGSFGSAQILMLSGIGPKDDLAVLKIPVISDLPVGKVFENHLTTEAVQIEFEDKVTVTKGERETIWAKLLYLIGKGPIALFDSVGDVFMKAPSQPKDHKFPYLQIIMAGFGCGEGGETIYNATRDAFLCDHKVFDSLFLGLKEGHTATFLIILLHPSNPGSVKLMSTNPLDPPLIYPYKLSDSQDIKIMIEGIRETQKFVNTTAFHQLGAKLLKRHNPSCKKFEYDSDSYWECYLKNGLYTHIHHVVGTCRMGPVDGDPGGIVDSHLRVHGIPNLRVIDASIMPMIPSGGPMGTVYMIAEKGADMIRKDRN